MIRTKSRVSSLSYINIAPVITRAFEKIVHHCHARETIENVNHLSATQFAYGKGGNCTDLLFSIQHRINSFLDNPDCKEVRLFAMDFWAEKLLTLLIMNFFPVN